ncbi:MAG: outer membrane protein assembly factor BamC [Gammaproteobacteria bacterium]|nr:outer membrane protein assembly factor BamC [Gammaproteobacteria bacterium]
MRHIYLFLFIPLLSVLILLLSACGLLGTSDPYSYKTTKSVDAITVPQHLKRPEGEHTLIIPDAKTDVEGLIDLELPPEIVTLSDIEKKVEAENTEKPPESPALTRQTLMSRATKDIDGNSLLIVEADMDKVWPNMVPALKELGFDIEDASRGNQVIVIVKELPTLAIEEKKIDPGEERQIVKETYQIHLKALGDETQITVHNKYGKREGSGLADHLLLQIQERIENPNE